MNTSNAGTRTIRLSRERAAPPPETLFEQSIAEIWGEVLCRGAVGSGDHFFELGGHSLDATRVTARCRRVLRKNVSVKLLFDHPRFKDFATAVAALPEFETQEFSLPSDQVVSHPQPTESPVASLVNPSHETLPNDITQRRLIHAVSQNAGPLSYAQLSCFFRYLTDPRNTVDHLNSRWRLRGPLNVTALRGAVESVIHRQDALRTVFRFVDGEPRQIEIPPRHFELQVHDLRELSGVELTNEIERRSRLEAQTPFNLSQDVLIRAQLLRVAETEHILFMTEHHISSDGLSQQVFWQELQVAYQALQAGESLPPPVVHHRYRDFVLRQRNQLLLPDYQRSLDYWRQELRDVPSLDLPTDHTRPARLSYAGEKWEFQIPDSVVKGLQTLSLEWGVTLHVLLLSAFHVLLFRYTGQTDFAVGVPDSGREFVEDEDLMGLLVNTLTIRLNLSHRPSFRLLVQQAIEKSLQAYEHRNVPFEKMIDEFDNPHGTGRNPLIQVLFQFLTISDPETLGQIQLDRLPALVTGCHLDLELCLRPQGAGIRGEFVFNTDLFQAATIQRMATHYLTLLAGVVANPAETIDRLPLLTESEQRTVLSGWNQTDRAYPQLSVSRLFEHQVAQRPWAIAASFAGKSLTYAELNVRANRLAHYLLKQGIRPEEPIGISIDRSFELLIGLLAILKSGAAYVPLDAKYPDERLTFMLADTQVGYILTQADLVQRWERFAVQPIVFDQESPEWLQESTDNPGGEISPDQLAYIMYTSGSTGVAKGVEILQRGIVNLLCNTNYVQLDETQTVLHLATLSFDASTFEIWGPLLNGGRCVLAPPGFPDLYDLQSLIQHEKVRTAWLTSTLFNTIVDEQPALLAGLEQLLIGGEAISSRHVQRAQQILGTRTQIINGYGPTECTTFATCDAIPPAISAEGRSLPIGRPIQNTKVYVLDENRQLVPINVPGELYLSGPGLARGYLHQASLTAEKFVNNPFTEQTNAKMYRTGDLVRWLPTGKLEFLRRIDQQVKLRGYRIELGEIESCLLRYAPIKQVVVILQEQASGDQRLVAFYVPDTGRATAEKTSLREILTVHLPEYMIPSDFVELTSLPRTANGKINRRALTQSSAFHLTEHSAESCPRSPAEELLAGVWKKLLQRNHVGIHENFFELGGHSLLALRMVDMVNRSVDQRLCMADVFAAPTISRLARVLGEKQTPERNTSCGRYLEPLQVGSLDISLIGVGTHLGSLVDLLPMELPIWWLKLDGIHVWPHQDLSISAHAELDLAELESAVITKKVVLFGFSWGGLLATEIARKLMERGSHEITLILLEPSLVSARQHLHSRHDSLDSDAKSQSISGRVSRFVTQCQQTVKFIYRRGISCWKRGYSRTVTEEQRWEYCKPFLLRQIDRYLPPTSIPCDVHLIGRPEYLESWDATQQSIYQGHIKQYPLPAQLTHLETIAPENCHVWGRIIQDCLAQMRVRD